MAWLPLNLGNEGPVFLEAWTTELSHLPPWKPAKLQNTAQASEAQIHLSGIETFVGLLECGTI